MHFQQHTFLKKRFVPTTMFFVFWFLPFFCRFKISREGPLFLVSYLGTKNASFRKETVTDLQIFAYGSYKGCRKRIWHFFFQFTGQKKRRTFLGPKWPFFDFFSSLKFRNCLKLHEISWHNWITFSSNVSALSQNFGYAKMPQNSPK